MSSEVIFTIFLALTLLFQVGTFGTYAEAQGSPDFGLQRSQSTIELGQNHYTGGSMDLIVSPRNGFDSKIDLVITVDPPDAGVSASIDGKTKLSIEPKNKLNLDFDIDVSDDTETGEYKVTVTGTSIINGQQITRVTFFTVKINPPSEFFIESKPHEITVQQGGSAFTNIKTTATKQLPISINLEAWTPITGEFTSKFSGNGQLLPTIVTGSWTEWHVKPTTNNPTNSQLMITASPSTPTGTYTAHVTGTMEKTGFGIARHTIPLIIHVTANPSYSHLQLPTDFDLLVEYPRVSLEPGSTFDNDIHVIDSQRPDDAIRVDATIKPVGQGVTVDVSHKKIIPNKPATLKEAVTIFASDNAKPGTYTVTVTGTSKTFAGQTLTHTTTFDVIIPLKQTEKQSSIMPDWFKNNAKWLKEGLIADSDMINALESLMIQDVIPLDKFVKSSTGIEHQAGIPKGGTFVIPSYEKNVFGFWSEGSISDDEIVNSIGYLVGQGIINSEKITERKRILYEINLERAQSRSLGGIDGYASSMTMGFVDPNTKRWANNDPESTKSLFLINKWYELSAKLLLSAKNGETNLLDDAKKKAWDIFSKTKDKDVMNDATLLENSHKKSKQDTLDIVKILQDISLLEDDILQQGKKQGISAFDFEKETKEQQQKIDDVKPSKTEKEIKDAKHEAKKSFYFGNGIETQTFHELVTPKSVNVKIIESNGVFFGDPCDEDSKRIAINYKLDFSDKRFPLVNLVKMSIYVDPPHDDEWLLRIDNYIPQDQKLSFGTVLYDAEFSGILYPKLPPGKYHFDINSIDWTFASFNILSEVTRMTVEVPPCPNTLNVAPADDAPVDSVTDDLGGLPFGSGVIYPKDSDSVVDELNAISNALNEILEDDDPLPGIDYDLSDDEIKELSAGLADVIVFPTFKESNNSQCTSEIEIQLGIEDEDLSELNSFNTFDVILIENGPRGKITHNVEMAFGSGVLYIKNPLPGQYIFDVNAIFTNSGNDIFSGNYLETGLQRTVIVPACSDDSGLAVPEEPAPYVVPESTSSDYTISVTDPLYKYFGDLDNCNVIDDVHAFGWQFNISPSSYDVDNGVFVGKIMIEHYDGTTEYVESSVADEPNVNWNMDAGPPGSISYATLLDVTSPTGLSINFNGDPNMETITMITPQCTGSSVEFDEIRLIDSLQIGGKYYPYVQFIIAAPDSCGVTHYHSITEHATSQDLTITSDPSIGSCGFGTVSAIPRASPVYYVSEILAWKETTGIDIPGTESLDVSNDSNDSDGDGIEDSIDTKPNEFSNEFFDSDSGTFGKIVDRAGHTVTITKQDGTIQIKVGTDGGTDPAIVEILGVELELEPGTTMDASFG